MMGSDPARAFYGPGHVKAAHAVGAVQVCVCNDTNGVQLRG